MEKWINMWTFIFHIDLNKIFRHRPLMVCLKRQVHIDLNNLFKHRPLPHFYQIPNCLKIFKRPTSPASPRTRIPCSSLPLPHPHWPPCNTNFVLPHITYIYNISRNWTKLNKYCQSSMPMPHKCEAQISLWSPRWNFLLQIFEKKFLFSRTTQIPPWDFVFYRFSRKPNKRDAQIPLASPPVKRELGSRPKNADCNILLCSLRFAVWTPQSTHHVFQTSDFENCANCCWFSPACATF